MAVPSPSQSRTARPGGLQDEAGTQRLRRLELIKHGNAVAGPVQRQRGRKPRWPGPGNTNVKRVHQATSRRGATLDREGKEKVTLNIPPSAWVPREGIST
jgi:hypothetical protein